uniref:Uncharacterized protein n=1 Tax=Oryza punctata TaxID=4537 RepID=A0A0E0LV35_ORYPU
MMDRTGSCQQANPAAGESRASHHLPHHHGRRRRRHRALLGGAASIAHPSPLGLISGSLHFLRVLLKILPSLSTLTGIADSVYLLRLQKQTETAATQADCSTHISHKSPHSKQLRMQQQQASSFLEHCNYCIVTSGFRLACTSAKNDHGFDCSFLRLQVLQQ